MMFRRLFLTVLAGAGLAGCVPYQDVAYAPPPRPVYVAPPPGPVYVAPPPDRVYVQPRRRWVPRRCDVYGRCWGGYWR